MIGEGSRLRSEFAGFDVASSPPGAARLESGRRGRMRVSVAGLPPGAAGPEFGLRKRVRVSVAGLAPGAARLEFGLHRETRVSVASWPPGAVWPEFGLHKRMRFQSPAGRQAPPGWSLARVRESEFQSPAGRKAPPGWSSACVGESEFQSPADGLLALSDSRNQRWAGPLGLLAGLGLPVREEVGQQRMDRNRPTLVPVNISPLREGRKASRGRHRSYAIRWAPHESCLAASWEK